MPLSCVPHEMGNVPKPQDACMQPLVQHAFRVLRKHQKGGVNRKASPTFTHLRNLPPTLLATILSKRVRGGGHPRKTLQPSHLPSDASLNAAVMEGRESIQIPPPSQKGWQKGEVGSAPSPPHHQHNPSLYIGASPQCDYANKSSENYISFRKRRRN